jgi:hypothetical protein
VNIAAREKRPLEATLVATSAAIDAVAAGILLFTPGGRLSPESMTAAALHGAAVLLLSGLAGGRPSRRWLCVAAVLAVPCVGAAVAAAALATRGRGSVAMRIRRRARRKPALSTTAMRRLGDALSPFDALDSGDEDQRRAALSTLSRRMDPEAIALLRRAAAGRDRDLALSAALVLDEIGERAESQPRSPAAAEVRHEAG